MADTLAPTAAQSTTTQNEVGQLQALQQQVAGGSLPDVQVIVPLTQSSQRGVRGAAKQLLAHVLLVQARQGASALLYEACHDLDFGQYQVLAQAVEHAAALQQWDRIVELSLRAGENFARRGEFIQALVQLKNAATTDIAHGAGHVNDPKFLRRVMQTYERVAKASAPTLGIQAAVRGRRRSPTGGRLRLAHVVCQLVDHGHAPSRSVETMLKFADRERFETYLCVTESLVPHEQHMGDLLNSPPSAQRAPQRIMKFQEEYGIQLLMPRTRRSFLAAAADLHQQFADRDIDVAFFHGSVALPTEWLMCAWQIAPWQLDAGFGVPLHCPHVDYQFFEFEETMEQLAFWCRERNVAYGYKQAGADMSHVEEAEPFSREELQIPPGHVILGTVGNHLQQRMSRAFCETVAGVMRACPATTLLAVGGGDFGAQREVFGDLCQAKDGPPRVRFVGHCGEIGRMTQTFDIYLNSFPEGGGFTIGDAMAAGKPVVCMMTNDAPLASAGRTWVGPENLVTPATVEAYASRLRELIGNAEARAELGRRMRQRYEERFDARRWIQRNADLICEMVERGAV